LVEEEAAAWAWGGLEHIGAGGTMASKKRIALSIEFISASRTNVAST
jgi:hypothetical protein